MITVSILGVGARGGEAYGRNINPLTDKFDIVSLCDKNTVRLEKYGKIFNVLPQNRFTDENTFFEKKRSDLIIISTLDRDHFRHAKKAIELGYNIMVEKPVSDKEEELKELLSSSQKKGVSIFVCHVLRYTPMMLKIKEILDSGVIGKLIHIDQTEHVGFWHIAHSYVRGNWRNTDTSSFMLMAKCCHDLDLLQYFANSKCEKISSFGALNYFKPEFKPEGSSNRCCDCKFIDDCCYSAKKIYLDRWRDTGSPENCWPFNTITDAEIQTEENLINAIKNGPYGRCVFSCDNNVVDNQIVNMQFSNGITAALKMIGFAKDGGRNIRFYGTKGEIVLLEDKDTIEVKLFFGENKVYKISEITPEMSGHSGGDMGMLNKMYEVFTSKNEVMETSLERSVYSHLMAITAEQSRLQGGKLIEMK